QLMDIAKKLDVKIVSIEDLVAYRMQHDSLIEKKEDFKIETRFGSFRLRAYNQTTNNQTHIALTKGEWNADEEILTRINSSLIKNDILGTLTNNVDEQLYNMFQVINNAGKGAIIFINQQNQTRDRRTRLTYLKGNQNAATVTTPGHISRDKRDCGCPAQ